MVFAVATMVVFSHGGEAQRLKSPLGVVRIIGAGVALALAARVSADLLPGAYLAHLGSAAAVWMAMALIWLAHALPRLVRTLPPGEFERMHNEAKQRSRTAC